MIQRQTLSKRALPVVGFMFLTVAALSQTANPPPTVTITNAVGQTTNVPASVVDAANAPADPVSRVPQVQPQIRVDSGGAAAEHGLLSARFTPNLAESRPVTLTTTHGRAVAFRPTFIVLVRRSTGETWLVGEVTNSVLEVSPSEVVYRDAFDTISADLRYGYAANGSRLEQFVTIHERVLLPQELTNHEDDLNLECWTEFFLENEPVSVQETTILLRAAGLGAPAIQAADQSTDLGSVRIPGGGRAFGVGEEQDTFPVAKSWLTIPANGTLENAQRARRFLRERTDWLTVKPRLDQLPRNGHASLYRHASSPALLAGLATPAAPAQGASRPLLAGRNPLPATSGLVIDFMVAAPAGLVAWWKGEGNALDSAGSFDGEPQGFMKYAAAEVGQGFNLDGADDWVLVNSEAPLNFGAGADFSIEGWINAISDTTTYGVQMILDNRVTTVYDDGAVGYALYLVYGQLGCQLADGPLASYQYHAYGPAGPDLRGGYHHVALTVDRDNTSGGKFYVDGNLVGTFNPTLEPGDLSNTGLLQIGKHASSGINAPFKGVIDELSIYNRALSLSEVQSIFNAGSDGKAVPPTITTQPVSQNMAAGASVTFSVAAAGAAPFTFQWRLNGQNICGATASTYTRDVVQPTDQGSYSVVVSNPGGSVTSVDAVLTVSGAGTYAALPLGLVSWWRAGCDAADAAGLNPGTLINGAGFAAGKVGRGFTLNGASQYVQVPSSTSLRLSQEYTIECWYKDTGSLWYYGLIAKRSTTSPCATSFGINICPNSVVQLYFLDPTYVNFQICDYSVVPSANTFHHIAGTYRQINSTQVELKLYIDGTCVKTVTRSGNLANCQNDVPVTIGASTAGGEYMVGVIDDVSVYNRALSATEIQGIYNAAAAGKDPSDVDRDGVPDSWEMSYFGNLQQSGTDDFDGDGLKNAEEYQLGTDPTRSELAVTAHKNFGEDKFEVHVNNLSGRNLTAGTFDLYAYFDGVNRTHVETLQPWDGTDVLQNGTARDFTFCTTDHSILNYECIVLYRSGSVGAASAKFAIVGQDGLVPLKKNTTQMSSGGGPPQPSPSTWPQPLPVSAAGSGSSQEFDNFYKAPNPPELVQLGSSPKAGFKNVYAIKQWHGAVGPGSTTWGGVSSMGGHGSCMAPLPPSTQPDPIKYLSLDALATYKTTVTDPRYNWDHLVTLGTAESHCSVDPKSGRCSGSASNSGDDANANEAATLLGKSTLNRSDLVRFYLDHLEKDTGDFDASWPIQRTYSAPGPTPIETGSYTFDGSDEFGTWHQRFNSEISIDLAAGSISGNWKAHRWGTAVDDPPWDEAVDRTLTVILSGNGVSFNDTYVYTWSSDYDIEDRSEKTLTATFSSPYTSADVNSDCDTLLATWDLLDDDQYPWRSDAGVTRGPLVTYNERGATAPTIVYPGFADTTQPPWPSQPECPAAILGGPLPVHGPGGEIYTFDPYFNFYHINWRYEDTERGRQGFVDSYGAFSPYPNATQWVDDQQAKALLAGPFSAYGSIMENEDHFAFRLKDPNLTDTLGNYEQGGMPAGCLIKCKWAETLTSPVPPGTDLVFKSWSFNFRDFIESYQWNAAAWSRNNIETYCPGISAVPPVRFTPVSASLGQPGAGYYIGPGSWWISDMQCLPEHYDYTCCQPAVYVQPGPSNPDCGKGKIITMPPAQCDDRYGSLWVGRVDQSTADAHGCDGYVANRNNGVPNPASCEPQICLYPAFHGGSTYETFVAPLGFAFGGGGPLPLLVDLDIDSDNDNGTQIPDRSPAEDAVEDDPSSPGKIVVVNDGDSDADGVPGFADGFGINRVGTATSDDHFVPIILQIPSDLTINDCRILISYSASEPKDVKFVATPPSTTPAWTPAPGNLRIWLKDGDQLRNSASALSASPGDYVTPGMYNDITKLGFSTSQRAVTLYAEGIAPSSAQGDLQITAVLYANGDPPRSFGSDTIRVTVMKVNLDIARKDQTVVPQDQEASSGGIVQIVPELNPGSLYPQGIFLSIPVLGIEPAWMTDFVTLKLKKTGPTSSQGKIRVYRQLPGEELYSVFLGQDDTEKALTTADFGSTWRLDSTVGGVVDLALVAELASGTELGRDTVRISSIPCEPASGRIVFVNPSSSSPAPPYDNFTQNGAHTIAAAVAVMQADDNILLARFDPFAEWGIAVPSGGVVAGLAGEWKVSDPLSIPYPASDAFDFTQLPALRGPGLFGGTPASAFIASGVSSGAALRFGGLRFVDEAAGSINALGAGGALRLENLTADLPVRVSCCSFDSDVAADFGGAIYLSSVGDVAVELSEFKNNLVSQISTQEDQYDKGMGGAIASIESSLVIANCSFADNTAQVVGLAIGSAPPLGCAGGGGDVYAKEGSLTMSRTRLERASAGFPLPPNTDPAPDGSNFPQYFTGDGGSLLVHCPNPTTIDLSDTSFQGPTAYGNGGAVCISYDSSPIGRAYFTTDLLAGCIPQPMSGTCSGNFVEVLFTSCNGGWQGGAVSADGSGMNLTFKNCTYSSCHSGTAHLRDGKGGAVAFGGGIRCSDAPSADIILDNSKILSCDATGNGGGVYATIRGRLTIQNAGTIQGCTALNAAQNVPPGTDRAQYTGLGGGAYASAGGFIYASKCSVINNVAKSCGGGLAAKTATLTLGADVLISRNIALGNANDEWGNGGGIYVTTCAYEGNGMAASQYGNDGTVISSGTGSVVSGNGASRWGGGLYAGLHQAGFVDGAVVQLVNVSVTQNTAAGMITDAGVSLSPSQIAAQNVQSGIGSPILQFSGTTITGLNPTTDIGIYENQSVPICGPGGPVFTSGTLARNILSQ